MPSHASYMSVALEASVFLVEKHMQKKIRQIGFDPFPLIHFPLHEKHLHETTETPPKFNSSPLKRNTHFIRKVIFQSSFFRAYVKMCFLKPLLISSTSSFHFSCDPSRGWASLSQATSSAASSFAFISSQRACA